MPRPPGHEQVRLPLCLEPCQQTRPDKLFNQGGNYATPAVLAGGMWEALLTAAAGIAVAIPALLARHFLTGRVRALVQDMEWAGSELMRFLLRDYRSGNGEKK